MEKSQGVPEAQTIGAFNPLRQPAKPQDILREHQAEVRRGARPEAEIPTGRHGAVHVRPHGVAGEVRGRSLRRRDHAP